MKGITENGSITVLRNLPKQLETENGLMLNFDKASKETLEGLGYYDIIKPSFDRDTQYLGNLFFDTDKFTYPVNDIDFTATHENEDGDIVDSYDIAAKKEQKIKELKGQSNSQLSSSDWQVTRKFERSIDIDSDIVTKRAGILTEYNKKVTEVNALTDYVDALKYNTTFFRKDRDGNLI